MRPWGLGLVLLGACVEDPAGHLPPERDAGLDSSIDASGDAGDEDTEPVPPAPPARAALPILTPCPAGWNEVADVDDPALIHCAPWPAESPDLCAADEAHFPGGETCSIVGAPCPEGDWADELPDGAAVIYVRPDADGDGSRLAPWGTIAQALGAAPPGSVIALAKGRYHEAIEVGDAVTLWGACTRDTILAPDRPSASEPTIRLAADGAVVGNLSVVGTRPAIEVDAAVGLASVVVRDVTGTGVSVRRAASLEARELVVRDVTPATEHDAGLVIDPEAVVELDQGLFERVGNVGIAVDGGVFVARDLGVVDPMPLLESPWGSVVAFYGEGLRAFGGAAVELERAAFVGGEFGLRAAQAHTSLVATDLFVADVRSDPSFGGGPGGVQVSKGAETTISRASILRVQTGISVTLDDGGRLDLRDVLVADAIRWGLLATRGTPASGQEPASFLRRVAVVRGSGWGMTLSGPVTAEDLVVRDIIGAGDWLPEGSGIDVSGPAVTVERAHVRDVVNYAFSVAGSYVETDAVLRDLTVELATAPGSRGFGMTFTEGARAVVERAAVDNGGAFTVWARGAGTEVTMSDVVIRRSRGLDGEDGFGLMVLGDAHVTLTRALLEANRSVSILCHDGGVLLARDVLVTGTLEAACAEDSCPGEGGGFGLTSTDERSAIDMTRFRVESSALCGVQVALGGQMDLHLGVVRGSPIGANVQDPSFDTLRLQDRVVYVDVERGLDATALPVPRPGLDL